MILPVVFDLARNPPTYDFVTALLLFEKERMRRKADWLTVQILPGPIGGFRRDRLWPRSIASRQELLNAIVAPMAELLPRCDRVTIHNDRSREKLFGEGKYLVSFRDFVRLYGEGLRPLRPKGETHLSPVFDDLITITLREAEHWPERNSQIEQWKRAAISLRDNGYKVLFVRDTIKADEPLDGFEIASDASKNLSKRAQIYRSAALNLFINNGPAWLALALDAPAIIFKVAQENSHFLCSGRSRVAQGMPMQCQMRGAPKHQRIVWENDDADVIVEETLSFMNSR